MPNEGKTRCNEAPTERPGLSRVRATESNLTYSNKETLRCTIKTHIQEA